MKRYNSKIGLGITIFIGSVLGIVALIMVFSKSWPGIFIIVLVVAFVFYVFRTTYYLIDGNQLIVRAGFVVDESIQIDKVFKILETNNPLSAPATSLDRLAIYYNEKDWIMISPREKEEFISHMIALNGKIVVIRKG